MISHLDVSFLHPITLINLSLLLKIRVYMFIKSVIVAIDENNAIGRDNDMLCYLPNDLKHFKATTEGHTVIMGRKTYESLPKGALPNRRNIVVSRNQNLSLPNTEVCSSIDDALALIKEDETEVFFMGGGNIYKQVITDSDRLYITYIHHSFEGADTFFPSIDATMWKEVSRVDFNADDKNKYSHTIVVYERK